MKLTAETTIFNDDKVQQKFSELIVDADGIRTEVSKKVGDDEVISRINQSAETIKIQADKVAIEGAAIFTSGRLSRTTLDSTYEPNGAVNVLQYDLASGSGTTVIDGGHIVTDTIDLQKLKVSARDVIDDAATKATNYITHIDNNGIRIHPSSTENNSVVINSDGMEVFKGGTTDPYSVAKYGDSARIGKAASKHISLDATNGMQVFTGTESDSTNVARFGDTARIGKEASRHVAINSESIDINNGSTTSASFGDDIILGKDSSYKTLISSDELTMMDNNNDPSFSVTSVGTSRTETITTSPVAPNRTSATGKTMSTSLAKYSTTYTFRPISPIDGSIISGSITYSFTANSAKSETRALSTTYGTISIQFIPQYKYTNNVRKVIKVQARITTTGASGKCIGVQKSYQTTVYPANMHFSGDNNLLWSADEAMYMISSQIIYLNELVSSQLTGIVIAWSAYVDSEMKNYDWVYSYVPKMHVITDEGHGVSMPMAVGPFTYIGSKYVYVYDDRIVGHENNNAHGSKNGVTYDNRHWIIRYVYGV